MDAVISNAARRRKQSSVLPGFGLTMGFSVTYLGLIVFLPLSTLFLMTSRLTWAEFWRIVSDERTMAAYGLSIGGAIIAAIVNTVFGVVIAWVLVRYTFPGKKIMDGLVDLPFALPTAVAGIALTAIYAQNGWLGRFLDPIGIKAAYSRVGVVIAMILVSLPFVVRTVQPVLEDLDAEIEEAAASLGARRWSSFIRVIFPTLLPAILTGLALSFAKSVGEYGSIIFIAGNLPGKTEIAPLLIYLRLEEFNYPAATAIAVGMLAVSFFMLLVINLLQTWTRRSAHT
ncbi:MAG: sulfate ABC transporter permease subunit CysT [Phycisphaeraceae bacterium]|nr:sulfate ABC transporter permease subunit CysT [Phycisphaeraceae bacterium]MBX3366945.1 sulfate ABC transporter permease subunit CysT [Phycisphaeraceae bacterium]QYK49759.1 MAG: sulfate ABC transporter permease subunit CysT [Phycisphaeraceae bacterium]